MAKAGVDLVGDPASLNAALGSASAEVVRLADVYKTSFAEMSDAALTLAVAQDKLAISTVKYGDGTAGAAAATLAYRKTLDGVATSQLESASKIGRALTMGITLPAAAVGYEAVKMAMSFDSAMNLIHTQAGASTTEVERMTGAVLDLTRTGQSYGQSAKDMALGLFPIESEGLRGAAALQVLKVAAAGAAVGQTDLADTANALTSAIRIFGGGASAAVGDMATLNAIVGQGKMHMDDLESALSTKFFPTAHAFGVTLAQAGAAVDVFTQQTGGSASNAATNLAQSLLRMEAPTSAGIKALDAFGLSATSLASDLESGGLPDALTALHSRYMQLVDDGQKIAANQDIFAAFGGSKGGAAALMMVQQYAQYMQVLQRVQTQSNPGTFWADVSSAMNEPANKIKTDVAELGASMIQLGNAIMPLATGAAHDIAAIASAFSALPGPVQHDLGIIIALLAVGGPLIVGTVAVIKAIKQIQVAFSLMGLAAPAAVAPAGLALDGLGAEAVATAGKVDMVKASLLGIAGTVVTAAILLELIPTNAGGQKDLAGTWLAGASKAPLIGGPISQGGALGNTIAGWTGQGNEQPPSAMSAAAAAHTNMWVNAAGQVVGKGTPGAMNGAEFAAAAQAFLTAHPTGTGYVDKRYYESPDQFAAAQFTSSDARRGGGVGIVPGLPGSPGSGSPATLTAAQQLTLELDNDPTNSALLTAQNKMNESTLAWLKRRWEAGKMSNAAYVTAAGALGSQIKSNESTISSTENAAKTAATQAAKVAATFTLPLNLQIAQAQAALAPDTQAGVDVAREIQAWTEGQIKTGHTKDIVGALQELASTQSTIKAGGTFEIPAALQDLEASAAENPDTQAGVKAAAAIKAYAETQIREGNVTGTAMTQAISAITTADSTIKAGGTWEIPLRLQLEQAIADTEPGTQAGVHVAEAIRTYAEAQIRAHNVTGQAMASALSAISSADSTIAAGGTWAVPMALQLEAGDRVRTRSTPAPPSTSPSTSATMRSRRSEATASAARRSPTRSRRSAPRTRRSSRAAPSSSPSRSRSPPPRPRPRPRSTTTSGSPSRQKRSRSASSPPGSSEARRSSTPTTRSLRPTRH